MLVWSFRFRVPRTRSARTRSAGSDSTASSTRARADERCTSSCSATVPSGATPAGEAVERPIPGRCPCASFALSPREARHDDVPELGLRVARDRREDGDHDPDRGERRVSVHRARLAVHDDPDRRRVLPVLRVQEPERDEHEVGGFVLEARVVLAIPVPVAGHERRQLAPRPRRRLRPRLLETRVPPE